MRAKNAERLVELAHGLIHKRGDNAAVDVTGRPFVDAAEMDLDRGCVIVGIDVELEVHILRICGLQAPK